MKENIIMKDIIQNEFDEHIKAVKSLDGLKDEVANATQLCIESLKAGGKILLCGNGGSAADAQHIAAELVGRFKLQRKGLPAIALTTDTSTLTSIGNDFGFNHIFKRQIEALASDNDVVIGISTSGNSENIINALKVASDLSCKTIGFAGQDGGLMNGICDVILVAPSTDTPRIQEMHIIIGHTICHLIDQEFSG
jgi:D-sedoheptulose 7-phosphate isomerase